MGKRSVHKAKTVPGTIFAYLSAIMQWVKIKGKFDSCFLCVYLVVFCQDTTRQIW
jgi:hypothetical protein